MIERGEEYEKEKEDINRLAARIQIEKDLLVLKEGTKLFTSQKNTSGSRKL